VNNIHKLLVKWNNANMAPFMENIQMWTLKLSKPWVAHTTLSQLQDMGNLPGSQPSTHLETHRNPPNSPQTAIHSILKQTNYSPHLWTSGGLDWHQGSTSDGKCSDVNDKTNKKTSSKEMACKMPSQIYEKGNPLVSEHSTCIKTHKMTTYGPQMARHPIQQQPNDGLTSQGVGGLKLCHC